MESGQLAAIEPGETEGIGRPAIGPFDPGRHTAVVEVHPAAGEAGDPALLLRERGFNVFEPGFSIDLRIVGELTPNQEAAFLAARERWEQVIVGSLEPTLVKLAANECWAEHPYVAAHPAVDEVVGDVLVIAMIGEFEDIIALAGPCVLRDENFLAAMGLMVFNIPAMQHFQGQGRLEDMVAHEIGHVLGINREVWLLNELLVGAADRTPAS